MDTATLSDPAKEAVASACAEVADPGPGDDIDGLAPGMVARPADTEQVAEVLRACTAHGLTVVPRGRGTKMSWGTPPRSADVLLDLSALDAVVEHAAGDLIVVTQAGTRLADLQEVVADGGQRLMLDETVEGGSVGGVLATNASGSRRVAVGTARDLLIGLTVVRADGVVAKSGGRVVKNVAGYDLGKLMVGSYGTLGVITEAVFRLHPLPQVRRVVTARAPDPAAAYAASQAVLHSQAVPFGLDVDWPADGTDGTGQGGGTVDVLVEGREEGVADRAATVERLLSETCDEVTGSGDAPHAGATYPWDPQARGEDRAVAMKLTFALSGLGEVLTTASACGLHVRGSAGSGVAYACLPPGTPAEQARTALDRIRATCTSLGGSAVVVDAPAGVKAALDVWGPVPALDLMRRVKDQFDPDHRLAPGRFVGGI